MEFIINIMGFFWGFTEGLKKRRPLTEDEVRELINQKIEKFRKE